MKAIIPSFSKSALRVSSSSLSSCSSSQLLLKHTSSSMATQRKFSQYNPFNLNSSASTLSSSATSMNTTSSSPVGNKLEPSIKLDKRVRGIYFDFGATTMMDPRVLDAMMPFLTEVYGNPHSRTHEFGWDAESAVELARKHIGDLIGASPKEIVFTSGATESNNTAIKGVASFYKDKKRHVITVQTEHKCVLDTCRHLEEDGFRVTYLPVKSNGIVDLEALEKAITPDTALVSVMMVNNEIGVLQPIKEIGKICRKHKVFLHTDCAQAFGKIPINVDDMNIDLMSISGHKIYGPKGIGALYVRRKQPRVRIHPIINGGGQEGGRRSGTLPAPLCVGLGEAARVAAEEMDRDYQHVSELSQRLINNLRAKCEHIELNGDEIQRYPGNVNISFAFVEGESLLMALNSVALSSGSACTSASLEPSYVLRALGVNEELAHTSLRFGIGRFTTKEEVDYVVERTAAEVIRLREVSPLYEMFKEGIDLSKITWNEH
ncbi:hypothetical protein C9374_010480 [Naegleria lovaniensis]|uniref:cysteine desulfurase n=1 Tax=Naegleria lovaniensis TaxID=51637 RepID=A0AA88KGA6_NAELO|nr:uncharacterized protein C9374_010480 [Naegleria lovaniensis]KAG2374736.1 hypothetical protein C9374_010480 [Naegleria lovaniensis]